MEYRPTVIRSTTIVDSVHEGNGIETHKNCHLSELQRRSRYETQMQHHPSSVKRQPLEASRGSKQERRSELLRARNDPDTGNRKRHRKWKALRNHRVTTKEMAVIKFFTSVLRGYRRKLPPAYAGLSARPLKIS